MVCESCGREIMDNEKFYVTNGEIYCNDCIVEEQITQYYFSDDECYQPLENVEKYDNKKQIEDSYSKYIKYLEGNLKNIPEGNVDKNYSKIILKDMLKRSKEFFKKVIDK